MEDIKQEDYGKIKDDFVRYRVMVNDAIKLYDQARSLADDSDKYKGLSESIKIKASPFCRGHFTLAVVGKMSAGKSTFINALLNDSGLLPTGHFQTTCTLTVIQHSGEKKLSVVYGDGHEDVFSENISAKLKELVAIPVKYKDIPVNNVNHFILDDIPIEKIIGKKSVDELEKQSKKKIDIDLLKEYVKEFPKNKIPTAVEIKCPLDEYYQGWKIVDTPGVDAIGGIEDVTKDFLFGNDVYGNPNVDAILFVQAAQSNIEDLHLNEFVNNTINSITDDAKKRTFFVLTHGSDYKFLDNKDKVLDETKKLFVEKVGIKSERVIVVDSIASLLERDDSLDLESLIRRGVPNNWNAEEWSGCQHLLRQVGDELFYDEEKEINNENLRRKLSGLANFANLRSLLNNFVKEEKKTAFEEIINQIKRDIKNILKIKKENISILKNKLGKEPEDFLEDLKRTEEKLEKFRLKANKMFREIKNANSKTIVNDKFDKEVNISLEMLRSMSSQEQIKRKVNECRNKAESVKKNIVEKIKKDANDYIENSLTSINITLPTIDIDRIADDAKEEAPYRVKKTHKLAGLQRFLGKFFRKEEWGYEIKYRSVVNYRTLATEVYNEFQNNLNEYKSNVQKELGKIIDTVDLEIKKAVENRKNNYHKLYIGKYDVDTINKKEDEVSSLQLILEKIGNIL